MTTRDSAGVAPGPAQLARSVDVGASDAAIARDIGLARVFPIFSFVYMLVYFFGVYTNYGPIRYYPAVNEVHVIWSTTPLAQELGPAMMWYGWVTNGLIGGIVVALLALLIPAETLMSIRRRFGWVLVVIPVIMEASLIYFLRGYWRS